LNVSLEVAAAQYAHYKALLPDVPLSTLVDFYLQEGPRGVRSTTLNHALQRIRHGVEVGNSSVPRAVSNA
jgi:hypothetical protein